MLQYKLHPDRSDELLYISKNVEDIFEVSKEDAFANNKLLWDRIHEDDLDEYTKSIKTSSENLSLWEQEHRIRLPGDRIKWLYTRGVPIQQDDGSVIWDTIALDITEQKRVQEELHEISETLKEAQRFAKIGSWWYYPAEQMSTWTDQMFHIFGLTPQPEAIPYEDHRKIIHPDDWDRFDAAVSRAGTDGTSVMSTIECRIKTGEFYPCIFCRKLPVDFGFLLFLCSCQAATSRRTFSRLSIRRPRH